MYVCLLGGGGCLKVITNTHHTLLSLGTLSYEHKKRGRERRGRESEREREMREGRKEHAKALGCR